MILDTSKINKKQIIAGSLIVLSVLFACYFVYGKVSNTISDLENKHQEAVTVSQEHMNSVNSLQNELHTTKEQAQGIKDFYEKALADKEKPIANYYVQAPTIDEAATIVTEQIKNKDTTLPPIALENTDRTAVVPNETQQKVDVYKINLDRKGEFGGVFTNHGPALLIGIAPNKDISVKAIYGKALYGAGVTGRF